MPDTTPEISVIICSYNRSSYIINAVNSLFHQTMQRDRFEVVVVDNNSIDNTGELVREFINTHPYFNLHYMTEKRQGASYARNTGAAIAKAPLLCFMDDDAVAEPDFLERIVAFFYATPDATGLGGF
jgi:glycosyltransferase involved in cell wall biosynthesis